MDTTRSALLVAFLNTRGTRDLLARPATYQRWATEWAPETANEARVDGAALIETLQPYASADATEDDLALLRTTRDTLLAMLDAPADAMAELDRLAPRLRLEPHAAGGALTLVPAEHGPAGLAALAVAVAFEAMADGTWERMDRCRNDECRWVFIDRSRNRSRRWCDMASCGNVQKARAYRERRRTGPAHTRSGDQSD